MKKQKIVLILYSLCLLLGGLFGFVFAHSMASLISGAIFGSSLLLCAFYSDQYYASLAKKIALSLIVFLFIFFTYRFLTTLQIMPAGIMALISATVAVYLLTQNKKKILS